MSEMDIVNMDRKEELKMVCDHICLNGRPFEVSITLGSFGCGGSLQGGRILFFLISEEGVAVGYYHDGGWEIPLDANDDELELAVLYFLEKYNRKRNMEVP